jgi:acyl-CoA dehydrogenase
MTDYNAPLKDMNFVIHELANLDGIRQMPDFADATNDLVEQVLEGAAIFARDVWGATNVSGDLAGCSVENKAVVVPEEFVQAYKHFVEAGWQSLEFSPEYDGMGLPGLVAAATSEMWQSANMAFSLCPMLTGGAIFAIELHASSELKRTYLPKMISGDWTGTMALTEPQAGSDLAAVKSRAVAENDHYRIYGTKIFITWGDQPFSENVIHLILARLPDAPEGIRGVSLFLVPKFLVNADGSLGERNDAYAVSVEHKLGIHGSPTCVLNFGDDDGAIGYLVGEENKGMACMFTMMNHARVGVGIQGLAISDRAYQQARDYAKDRVQGLAPGQEGRATIIQHPDVRRMLMVMKSQIEAMRAVAYVMSAQWDIALHSVDAAARAQVEERIAVTTPIVKAWMTEVAQELTSLGVQVHGGMGYVEETGAAQHLRDARILTIYEGTTGIQAMDLVGRKIFGDSGKALHNLLDEMRSTDQDLASSDYDLTKIRELLSAAVDEVDKSVTWLLENAQQDQNVPGAASVNLLMQIGTVMGGWQMARAALVASRKLNSGDAQDKAFFEAKLVTARFYFEHVMPRSIAYARAATAGSESTMAMPVDQF